jgi:hypothetical protein
MFRRSRFRIVLPASLTRDEPGSLVTPLPGRHRPERVAEGVSVWDLRDRETAAEWTSTEGQHYSEEAA